jgi:diguanylate cyclase (GGDEF)-like protein
MSVRSTGSRYAVHVIVLYVVLASVWTVFWHYAPAMAAPSSSWLRGMHAAEDWLLVAVSTIVLVLALAHINRQRYHFVFDNMGEGFVHCRVLFVDGQPQDFVCLDTNRAFYELTGTKTSIIGKKASAVAPDVRLTIPDVLEIFGRVARTGATERFETYIDAAKTWLAVSVTSGRKGHVVAVFDDITARKEAEARLNDANALLAIQMEQMRVLQARLQERAVHDPVMHIHNRSYLDEVLPLEAARARRQQDSFGVLLVDIDHFKLINDTYGHAVGDAILQFVARTLTTSLRADDVVCRYGGDEILCLLPGATCDATLERAEQLRHAIADTRVDHGEISVRVTSSIGAAVFPQHGAEIEEVLRSADLALYQAKADGRNRVQMARAGAQLSLRLSGTEPLPSVQSVS